MDYKYLAKNHISEQQTIIVRDYFETPLETHGNHLDHFGNPSTAKIHGKKIHLFGCTNSKK